MANPCPVCGFDDRSLSPADAAVALRSFPRRYGGILVRPDDEQEGDDPVRRPGASGWSALSHAAYASDAIRQADDGLRAILVRDHPSVTVPPVDPPVPATAGTPASVLDRLKAAVDGMATTIEGAHGDQWNRTGEDVGGATVTATDLARAAVHAGVHHLRQAESVLREVIGRA